MSKKIKILLIGILIITLIVCIGPFIISLFMNYIHTNDFTNSIYIMGIDTYPRLFESKKTKIKYYEVNDFNNVRKTWKFIPDEADIYTSESCFVDKAIHIIEFDLTKCVVYKNGKEIEKTPEIIDMYEKVVKSIEHSIIEPDFKIFEINNEYYVFAPLNVNMHTPVYFFRYNKELKELKFLYQLENIDVTGVKVKNK